MKLLLATALLFAGAPAAAQMVETAGGDWSSVPEMRQQIGAPVDANVVAAISGMVNRRECVIPGQRPGQIDMSVPFLVEFTARGTINRLVLRSLGCATAERMLAGAVLRMVENGNFEPVGGRREGWFRGSVGFVDFGS
jgi:hypothetical protein